MTQEGGSRYELPILAMRTRAMTQEAASLPISGEGNATKRAAVLCYLLTLHETTRIMSRQKKSGLDYFPFEVDFFQDIKIRKLIRRNGGKAIAVYALLLCYIYKSGYFMTWDKELPFIISEQTGYGEVYIQEVLESCLTLGLLDRRMLDEEGVLTSRGIQERYKKICVDSRRAASIERYNLIDENSTETVESSTKDASIFGRKADKCTNLCKKAPFLHKSVQESTQSKVKESKEKDDVEKAPPSPPTTEDVEASFTGLLASLRAEASWCELVRMRYHLGGDELHEWLDAFALDCRVNDKAQHTDLTDLKRHFTSWLRIQQQQNRNCHGTKNSNANSLARRKGIDVAATSAADYSTRL